MLVAFKRRQLAKYSGNHYSPSPLRKYIVGWHELCNAIQCLCRRKVKKPMSSDRSKPWSNGVFLKTGTFRFSSKFDDAHRLRLYIYIYIYKFEYDICPFDSEFVNEMQRKCSVSSYVWSTHTLHSSAANILYGRRLFYYFIFLQSNVFINCDEAAHVEALQSVDKKKTVGIYCFSSRLRNSQRRFQGVLILCDTKK